MSTEQTIFVLVLAVGALWFYMQGKASSGPNEKAVNLLKIEGRLAVEIEQLEARLTERNPNWREEERAESARRWDQLKAEGRLYERG